MKIRTRINPNVKALECKFEQNGNWYITSKDHKNDIIYAYMYRVVRYQINKLMQNGLVCDINIDQFAERLKKELGFDLESHNKVAIEKRRILEEIEAKRQEEIRIEKEKKKLQNVNTKNNSNNVNKKRRSIPERFQEQKSVHKPAPVVAKSANTLELNVRADIEKGMFKKAIKKKWGISNELYRRYKLNANIK